MLEQICEISVLVAFSLYGYAYQSLDFTTITISPSIPSITCERVRYPRDPGQLCLTPIEATLYRTMHIQSIPMC